METSPVFLSAGDPSGDVAASRLVGELRKLVSSCEMHGLGGPRLRQLGQHQLADPEDLAVLGFWEVARRFAFFRRLLHRSVEHVRAHRPRVIILVDYPGFNLNLAGRIRDLDIPVVYYISPQIWAWGRGRLKSIKKNVDLMLHILPFEQEFYSKTGVNAEFVGHYLLEDIPERYITSPPPESEPFTLALLPGSRPQEIERMLGPMVAAAREFNKKYGSRAVVAGIEGRFDYSKHIGRESSDGVSVSFNDSREIIFSSKLVLAASGTATLETAIIGRPMVVVYKTGFLTYLIARSLVSLDRIALVNLVLGEKLVAELIQGDATPANMVEALAELMENESLYSAVTSKLNSVPDLLGGRGASMRAARRIVDFVGEW